MNRTNCLRLRDLRLTTIVSQMTSILLVSGFQIFISSYFGYATSETELEVLSKVQTPLALLLFMGGRGRPDIDVL